MSLIKFKTMKIKLKELLCDRDYQTVNQIIYIACLAKELIKLPAGELDDFSLVKNISAEI